MPHDRTDANVLGPGRAPTPFTAEEIRDGCPTGRTIRLLVESDDDEPLVRVNQFVECDADGATIERWRMTADGEPLGPAEKERATWAQLQAHASFPADQTTIALDTIETPIGELECRRYTVRDGASLHTFWFATTSPGMPVKYRTEHDGRVITTATVISDTSP